MDSAAPAPVADAFTVGKAFVEQYYHILYEMPQHLHRFYQETSIVGRVGQDGVMRVFSTLQGITEGLKTLSYGDFKPAEITSFDPQASYGGGFMLVVTGYFNLNESLRRKFVQTFFLAPQENGYFVLNDLFKFVNEPETLDVVVVSVKVGEQICPVDAHAGNKGSEQTAPVSENQGYKEVSKPMNNENTSVVKEKVITEEVSADPLKISEPDNGHEDAPKKSYASVVKVKKDKYGVSTGALPSPKHIPKEQEHHPPSEPFPEEIVKDQSSYLSPPVTEPDAVSEVVDGTENGNNQGTEAIPEGTSIYVKRLPYNATVEMLETEFKQFGAISNDGIQVIFHSDFGRPFGFVEFVDANSAQKAIEASPVVVGGVRAFVEEKRSTARGNRGGGNDYGNRGGGNDYGNRNFGVGVRGRGNYGGGYGNNYRRGRGAGGRPYNRRGNERDVNINTY